MDIRLAVPAVAALLLVSCGNATESTIVRVSATSSLTEAFGELESAFENARPDVDVQINYAASSDLAGQILDGAPVDVFASADAKNMDKVVAAGLAAQDPIVFATNSLQIIVAPGNPLSIRDLADLSRDDLIVVTCDPGVPIGAYTEQVLRKAGVSVRPASYEENVKGIVAKVTSGEADAGIVYVTDVIAAGTRASGVDIPPSLNVTAEYFVSVLRDADHGGVAEQFVALLGSEEGRRILRDRGFGPTAT